MLPDGWVSISLGKVVSYRKGYAFDSNDYVDKGVRIIRISDTTRNSIHNENLAFVSQGVAEKLSDYLLCEGDILLSTVGSRPHLLDSMVGKAIQIPLSASGGLLNQNLVKLIPVDALIVNDFLYAVLKSGHFLYFISTLIRGNANQVSITLFELFQYRVMLPSLPEQKKIAQILSTWDKAITTTEQLLANSQQQKKALMQQLLTEKRRFLGFGGEWAAAKFDQLFVVVNDKKVQIKSSEYLDRGEVPIVDQGQQLIAGYTNNKYAYTAVPVIVFGDHTRIVKWVDFVFAPGADGVQLIITSPLLERKYGYYLIEMADIPNLGYSRHMRELKKYGFTYPVVLAEQEKIVSMLFIADQEIEMLQQKMYCLKQEKKGLMQQLLTGKKRVLAGGVA